MAVRRKAGGSRQRAFALALVVAAAWQLPAWAVDPNGLWRVGLFATQSNLTFTDTCALIVTQTDADLLISGHCEGVANPITIHGTIDSESGTFSGTGNAGACAGVTVNGTVAFDSKSFTGVLDCPNLQATVGVNASRCGNGQLDPLETCDDGNLVEGDCCSSSCVLKAIGTACTNDGSACTTDTCNDTGQCLHVNRVGSCNDGNVCTYGDVCVGGQCMGTALPERTACDDGNACTSGDECIAGTCRAEPIACPACLSCNVTFGCVPTITTGCKQAPSHALALRRRGVDAVSWRWDRGDATPAAELGDPTAATDYDFCVYDSSATANGTPGLVVSAQAPAGDDWHPMVSGFAYDRPDLTPDGLRRVLLKAGDNGRTRLRVKGVGAHLALPQLQSLVFPLTVQLKSRDGAGSKCWSARYDRSALSSSLGLRAGLRVRVPDTRPNILVINLDDTRADGIDRMPTLLSRVAGQGVTFTNSFTVNPLCSPSRASLFSGLLARHHGVRALGGVIGGAHLFRELGSDQQTVAVWLQAAGYDTGLFGKYINGYGFGTTEPSAGPGGTIYVPPGWSRWRAMTSPEHFGGVHGETYTLVDQHGVATTYGDHATDAQYSTDLLGSEVRAFIADAVSAGRPFFAVYTPYASHAEVPSLMPEPAARHLGFFRALPAWRPVSFAEFDVSDKPPWFAGLDNQLARIVLSDLIRIGAYETLLSVDEQLGLILDQLSALGVDGNTVVMVTSDNGSGWGEHRIYAQNKECPYEECLRVPLIVRDPRLGNTAIVQDAAVLNVDIAPTVAALAGVVPPVATDGRSFARWLGGAPPPDWRDDFLFEHYRSIRGDTLDYTGQVMDGDRIRVGYGDAGVHPRASVLFEFDDGSGVPADAIAVPIGVDPDATFAAFGTAVAAAVPFASSVPIPARDRINFADDSPEQTNLLLVVERDQGGVLRHTFSNGDYLGIRDVSSGYTYVAHETGDIELYDFAVDPPQLESKAGDPSYTDIRARMAGRLDELRR